jgi:aspartyl-tRNA(Asn)/glutamyl-tRNA(Gln) amidotransferase subunit A
MTEGQEPTGPWTSAMALRAAIARREISAREACLAALARIHAGEPQLHAFISTSDERAIARAEALDRASARGPLHGVPIALKDNISVAGMRTTAGSQMLDTYLPPFDATVTRRLEAAGAVVVGKTVCDEFAMGSSTENCAFGPARNPWALDRAPGGTSGGSTAAVAAGFVPLALGSDTGGSIRQPAAFCGVVGLKPTYGRVSRYGLIAFASSLDQIGPIARTTADAACLLEVMSGADPEDATAANHAVPSFGAMLPGAVKGVRIGVPRHLLVSGLEPGVAARFDDAMGELVRLGASVSTIELPHSHLGIAVYYIVATAEASANLARYDGVRYGRRAQAATLAEMYDRTRETGFGPEVKRRIMLGTYVLSAGYHDAYYVKAQQVRALIRDDYTRAFRSVDVVALPTAPEGAFPLGARTADPLAMYLSDVFTVGASLAGLPALSVPAGFTDEGLPVGLQLIGRAWDEATLLRAADAFERATPWVGAHPEPLGGRLGGLKA